MIRLEATKAKQPAQAARSKPVRRPFLLSIPDLSHGPPASTVKEAEVHWSIRESDSIVTSTEAIADLGQVMSSYDLPKTTTESEPTATTIAAKKIEPASTHPATANFWRRWTTPWTRTIAWLLAAALIALALTGLFRPATSTSSEEAGSDALLADDKAPVKPLSQRPLRASGTTPNTEGRPARPGRTEASPARDADGLFSTPNIGGAGQPAFRSGLRKSGGDSLRRDVSEAAEMPQFNSPRAPRAEDIGQRSLNGRGPVEDALAGEADRVVDLRPRRANAAPRKQPPSASRLSYRDTEFEQPEIAPAERTAYKSTTRPTTRSAAILYEQTDPSTYRDPPYHLPDDVASERVMRR